MVPRTKLKIVVLAGGVGGAKLVDGLAQVLQPDQLTVVVNTADDFTHLGLRISPDLDTVCYTLAGMANPETGWGRNNETWHVMEALRELQIEDWFRLGDTDLATHLTRTYRMSEGQTLSQITQEFCEQWGVGVRVLPMSDDLIQTIVSTEEGELGFQEYFVHRQCAPVVKGFNFMGADTSCPAPGVIEAIKDCDAVVVCPSNPWVSIDPILAVPSIREWVEKQCVVAVSPIVGNKTIKGPAAKMFAELGIQPSALAVADHYSRLIDAIFIDNADQQLAGKIEEKGIQTICTDIIMKSQEERVNLAGEILDFISEWLTRDSR